MREHGAQHGRGHGPFGLHLEKGLQQPVVETQRNGRPLGQRVAALGKVLARAAHLRHVPPGALSNRLQVSVDVLLARHVRLDATHQLPRHGVRLASLCGAKQGDDVCACRALSAAVEGGRRQHPAAVVALQLARPAGAVAIGRRGRRLNEVPLVRKAVNQQHGVVLLPHGAQVDGKP